MTIGNGQSQIDQIDVNTQVAAETSRSGGQGSLGQPRVRHCESCGKAGHNARTCQETIEISEEEVSDYF
jgi:hypothetical protein